MAFLRLILSVCLIVSGYGLLTGWTRPLSSKSAASCGFRYGSRTGRLYMRVHRRTHGPSLPRVGRQANTLARSLTSKDANKVFVANLDFSVTKEELQQFMEPCGDVVSCKIIKNQYTNKPKGYGFVIFALPLQATVAIEDMTGKEFKGRIVEVKAAVTANKPQRAQKGRAAEGDEDAMDFISEGEKPAAQEGSAEAAEP